MNAQTRIQLDTDCTQLRLAITAENWEAVESIANQISYTAHREKLDKSCDESGCVSKSLPLIKPITTQLLKLEGWN